MPQLAAFAGLPGPTFSSSAACPWFFSPTPHQGEVKPIFSHLGSPLPFNSSTTGSHSFNGAGNPFCWCHFPTLASKSQTGSHTGFSLFCSVSLPTFPLRGKAGLFSNLGCAGFARLAHNCPTRLQQGRSGAFLASFPYLALKTGHRATQGRVWFHRRFLVRFFCGSPASWRSRW